MSWFMENDVSQSDDDFRSLLQRVSEGSEDAAWELVERYGDELRRAVRRCMNRRLRPKFDSLDFVQQAWASFFRHPENALRFERPEELVAFLMKIGMNKTGMEARRRLMTEKYNVNREVSLERARKEVMNIPDGSPSAMDVLTERELREELVSGLPDRDKEIIRRRLDGHTNQETANWLGIAAITVRRFWKKFVRQKERLDR